MEALIPLLVSALTPIVVDLLKALANLLLKHVNTELPPVSVPLMAAASVPALEGLSRWLGHDLGLSMWLAPIVGMAATWWHQVLRLLGLTKRKRLSRATDRR